MDTNESSLKDIISQAKKYFSDFYNSALSKKSSEQKIKILSYLFSNGIKYEQIIDNRSLTNLRFNKDDIEYVNFVYSRDEIFFLPGQWYKFEFIDLILIKKFFEQNYSEISKNNKVNHQKFIGLLFAIYVKYKNRLRRELNFVKNNSERINIPDKKKYYHQMITYFLENRLT